MRKFIVTSLALGVLAACSQETKENLGLSSVAPDEFAVVTRAPLSVPPDYALRPPVPGKQRPMEISTTDTARQTVFGVKDVSKDGIARQTSTPSGGFLDKVGATDSDPNIRAVIDTETASGIEDNRPTAEKLMFWRDEKPEDQGTPIDPAEEMQRLKTEGVTTIKKRNEDVEAP